MPRRNTHGGCDDLLDYFRLTLNGSWTGRASLIPCDFLQRPSKEVLFAGVCCRGEGGFQGFSCSSGGWAHVAEDYGGAFAEGFVLVGEVGDDDGEGFFGGGVEDFVAPVGDV